MTETPEQGPGTEEPLILERLSDLEDTGEYLEHYPDIRNQAVLNPKGDEVGVVDDLYVNPREGLVEMASITFTAVSGYGGKHVLVPVEELQIGEGVVRILTHAEKVRLAPEFHPGMPSYEPYYEYWSSSLVGPTEEPSEGYVRPPGKVELGGEEEEEEEIESFPRRSAR